MKLLKFESARHFLERVKEFLDRQEAVNNLILGLVHRLARSEAAGERITDVIMCAVEEQAGSLALVMFRNDRNLIVYGEGGERCELAIKAAAADLLHAGLEVPGIIGPTDIAGRFAAEWGSLTVQEPVIKMNQRIYRLDKVNPVSCSPGSLRTANSDDLKLVADWIYEFAESIDEQLTREQSANKAREFINESSVYLWENEQPVSMVRKTRATQNGIVIAYVYTPPQFRGKGYATSAVATLSRLLLDQGYRFCALYTDLSNPTSNHIYSAIGYEPVRDSTLYRFR